MKKLREYKRVVKATFKKMIEEVKAGKRDWKLKRHYKYDDHPEARENVENEFLSIDFMDRILDDLERLSFIKLSVEENTITLRYHSNEWIILEEVEREAVTEAPAQLTLGSTPAGEVKEERKPSALERAKAGETINIMELVTEKKEEDSQEVKTFLDTLESVGKFRELVEQKSLSKAGAKDLISKYKEKVDHLSKERKRLKSKLTPGIYEKARIEVTCFELWELASKEIPNLYKITKKEFLEYINDEDQYDGYSPRLVLARRALRLAIEAGSVAGLVEDHQPEEAGITVEKLEELSKKNEEAPTYGPACDLRGELRKIQEENFKEASEIIEALNGFPHTTPQVKSKNDLAIHLMIEALRGKDSKKVYKGMTSEEIKAIQEETKETRKALFEERRGFEKRSTKDEIEGYYSATKVLYRTYPNWKQSYIDHLDSVKEKKLILLAAKEATKERVKELRGICFDLKTNLSTEENVNAYYESKIELHLMNENPSEKRLEELKSDWEKALERFKTEDPTEAEPTEEKVFRFVGSVNQKAHVETTLIYTESVDPLEEDSIENIEKNGAMERLSFLTLCDGEKGNNRGIRSINTRIKAKIDVFKARERAESLGIKFTSKTKIFKPSYRDEYKEEFATPGDYVSMRPEEEIKGARVYRTKNGEFRIIFEEGEEFTKLREKRQDLRSKGKVVTEKLGSYMERRPDKFWGDTRQFNFDNKEEYLKLYSEEQRLQYEATKISFELAEATAHSVEARKESYEKALAEYERTHELYKRLPNIEKLTKAEMCEYLNKEREKKGYGWRYKPADYKKDRLLELLATDFKETGSIEGLEKGLPKKPKKIEKPATRPGFQEAIKASKGTEVDTEKEKPCYTDKGKDKNTDKSLNFVADDDFMAKLRSLKKGVA